MVSLGGARRSPCINSSPKARRASRKDYPASGQIEATDRQIDGGPALWADGGGDPDCGGGEKLEAFGESF